MQNITNQITIEKSGSNLLISASPKKIAEIESIVNKIDVPATQIMLEARLIEVSLKDETEMGIDWEKLASTSIIFAEGGVPQFLGKDSNGNDMWWTPYPGGVPEIKTQGDLTWLNETFTDLPFLGPIPIILFFLFHIKLPQTCLAGPKRFTKAVK